MSPVPVQITLSCPVCEAQINSQQLICGGCGWLNMLYSKEPEKEQVRRLEKLHSIKKANFNVQLAMQTQLEDLKKQVQENIEPLKKLDRQLGQLNDDFFALGKEKKELESHIVQAFDFEKLEKKIEEVEKEKMRLEKFTNAEEAFPIPPVSLQCVYDSNANVINVVATNVRFPVKTELLLALAVSSKPFNHYSDADEIIPVKASSSKMISEEGQEFSLELSMRPMQPIAQYEIIHLYALTLSKFTIQ